MKTTYTVHVENPYKRNGDNYNISYDDEETTTNKVLVDRKLLERLIIESKDTFDTNDKISVLDWLEPLSTK